MKRSALPLLLCAALASPAPAFAQSAPAPAAHRRASLSESLTGAAKTDFASAQILIHNGDFAGAFTKLGHAYDLSKDPRLLFNMAICARDMHDYARMRALLVRYEREGRATMAADEKAQVDAALTAIRELVGAVALTVNEEGASVAVDGETIGTTPLDERVTVNLGKHTITVSKTGFLPEEETVDVAGGSETPLSVTLRPPPELRPAHLVVASDEDATVVIDGKDVAHGRFDGPLSAGVHDVSVTESGKVPYKAQIDLHDGETRTVDVTLEDEKHGGSAWPWILGGVAVAAGAAAGAYFLLKPADQAPATLKPTWGTVTFAAFGGR